MKPTDAKGSKVTPRSLINQKKAIESRNVGKSRTPGRADENQAPTTPGRGTAKSGGKRKDVTPLYFASKSSRPATPSTPSRTLTRTPSRPVLFEFNEKLLVNSAGVSVSKTTDIAVDGTPSGHSALNRSRSATSIRLKKTRSLRRSYSDAKLEGAKESPAEDCEGGEISRIVVGVRVRPLQLREYGNTVAVDGCEVKVACELGSELTFSYDHAFISSGAETASQDHIYTTMVRPLLDNAFLGYNACLFAYGQTGSGKTYSMMGPETEVDGITDKTGIIPRFCLELMERSNSSLNDTEDGAVHVSTRVEISYLEVYNEKIRDLLVPNGQNSLRVREHPVYGPYVADLSKHTVTSFSDIQNWITVGNKKRVVAATEMNESSSRSHSLFMVTLTQSTIQNTGDGVWAHEQTRRSQINLVDLAGSERISHSSVSSDRLREGVSINKSLLTLGKVISALVEKRSFVPYRESVLTWLLKESLGGNSRTAMLATVSPCSAHQDETLATLRYASQARAIVNTVRINESPQDKIIRELQAEVERLKDANTKLESKTLTPKRMRVKHDDCNDELTKLKGELTKFERGSEEMKNKLDEATVNMEKFKERAQLADLEVRAVEQRMKDEKEEKEEWRRKVEFMEEERKEWGERLTSLEQEWRGKAESLEEEVKEWKERLIAKEARENYWRSTLEQREQELSELSRLANSSTEEKEKLVERTDRYEKEAASWRQTVEDLNKEVTHWSVQASQTQQQASEMKNKYEALSLTNSNLQKTLAENEELVNDWKRKYSKLELEIANCVQKCSATEKQLLVEKQDKDILEEQMNVLSKQLEEHQAHTVVHLNTSVQVQTGENAEGFFTHDQIAEDYTLIKREMVKLREKFVHKMNKMKQLKAKAEKVNCLLKENETIRSEKENLALKLNEVLNVVKEKEEQIEHFKREEEAVNSELELLRDLEQKYKEKLNRTLSEDCHTKTGPDHNNEMFEDLSEMKNKLASSERNVSELNCLIKSLQEKLLHKESQENLIEASKNVQAVGVSNDLNKPVILATEAHDNWLTENSFDEVIKRKSEEVNCLKEMLSLSEQTCTQLKQQLQSVVQNNENRDKKLLKEVKMSTEEEVRLKEQLLISERNISELRKQLELSLSRSFIDKEDMQLFEEIKRSAEAINSLREVLKLSERSICQLTGELQTVENSFSSQENRETKLIEELEKNVREVTRLREKLASSEDCVARLTEQLQFIEHNLSCHESRGQQTDEIIRDERARIKELQVKLDQKNNLILELEKLNSHNKEEIAFTGMQLMDLTKQLNQMECNYKDTKKLTEEYRERINQLEIDCRYSKDQLEETAKEAAEIKKHYGETLLKNKELEEKIQEKESRLSDLHSQIIKLEEMLQGQLSKNVETLKKLQDKDNHLRKRESLGESRCKTELVMAKNQLERKKKRIEKLKTRIDKLEELLVSTMRMGQDKKCHATIREEHAKVFECMMEHSYLFHWEYLLKKARSYVHKYHIPYKFDGYKDGTALVKHLTLNAVSYWFRIDLTHWIDNIEKEDKWTREMDRNINWEVNYENYYSDNMSSEVGARCPIEEGTSTDIQLCCEPKYICPELWKRTIVTRHLSGLKEDVKCLLIYFRSSTNDNILDFLRCVDNLVSQLEVELHTPPAQ